MSDLYIPDLATDDFGPFVEGLAGNFVQIESSFAKWERIDTLSAPKDVQVAHADRSDVPVSQSIRNSGIYAIEFLRGSLESGNRSISVVTSELPTSTRKMVTIFGGSPGTISYVGQTSFQFYSASGDFDGAIYVSAIYLLRR